MRVSTQSTPPDGTFQDAYIAYVDHGQIHIDFKPPETPRGMRHFVEHVTQTTLSTMGTALLVFEVNNLVEQSSQDPSTPALTRWGWEQGFMTAGGKKISITRPRVRSDEGEVTLHTYRLLQSNEGLTEEAFNHVAVKVSMRDYEGVVNQLVSGYGISKSSVSRRWIQASAEELRHLLERPLDDIDLVVLVFDGIVIGNVTLVVGMGVDSKGKKHILGMWQGDTENSDVVKGLLDDLIRRGLDPNDNYLFVIDGSKALASAIRSFFGDDALIHRCQAHKKRNVQSYLSKSDGKVVGRRIEAAWKMRAYKKAREELIRIAKDLETRHPMAAASLREGMEETLTLHRLGLPALLRKSLRSTNIIESTFSLVRDLTRNVKYWSSTNMVHRWTGTSLLQAERRFHRIHGADHIQHLVSAVNNPPEPHDLPPIDVPPSTVDREEAMA